MEFILITAYQLEICENSEAERTGLGGSRKRSEALARSPRALRPTPPATGSFSSSLVLQRYKRCYRYNE